MKIKAKPTDRGPPRKGWVKHSGWWMAKADADTWRKKQRAAGKRTQKMRRKKVEAGVRVPELTEEERQRLLDSGYREIIQWVWRHLDDAACPAGATPEAKVLWGWARTNRGEFLSKYLPLLVKSEKPPEEEVDKGAVACAELVHEWLKRYEKDRCLHCGRTG